MTQSKDDSLLVEYDEDTRQMRLEWDDNDPKWNWLNSLSEEEVHEIITTNLKTLLGIINETDIPRFS